MDYMMFQSLIGIIEDFDIIGAGTKYLSLEFQSLIGIIEDFDPNQLVFSV